MADKTHISWTQATWNPLVGCEKCAPGCASCYAIKVVHRMASNPNTKIRQANAGLTVRLGNGVMDWTGRIRLLSERLTQPLRWKQPRMIFVNSLSDLFHPDVPFEFIDRVFGIMAYCPQHIFQILTKRPTRMLEYFQSRDYDQECGTFPKEVWNGAWRAGVPEKQVEADYDVEWPLRNVWLGVSVANQADADRDIPILLQVPAAVRWVSYEPAIGPINFNAIAVKDGTDGVSSGLDVLNGCRWWCSDQGDYGEERKRLDWLVIGGESGPQARLFNLQWAWDVVAQCRQAGVACFVKQLGAQPYTRCLLMQTADGPHYASISLLLKDKKGGNMAEWPEDLRVREFPEVAR